MMLLHCLPALLLAILPVLVKCQFFVPIRDVTDEEVVNMNGAGLVLFQFGQTNAWAKQKFKYTTSLESFPFLIDCFCDGDNLAIFVDGQLYDWTSEGSPSIGSTSCQIYEPDPIICFWKYVFGVPNVPRHTDPGKLIAVPPGEHEVEIFSLSSPFGQGYAIFGIGFVSSGSKFGLKNIPDGYTWEEFEKILLEEMKNADKH